ncbi:hypothetical protein K6Q96_21680 [Grimontia kaedaensis]|uniref:Lipoprotein n=1 Tax=Grimontia kaedaensis TaxID=2872157 RepID=A0ABY4WZE5_9GAMM|nr:hypothetical protein [Grimontia kaedaensis]USH04350.1 hypothetical protein K6Q96_21680 [Grimontia kaedaensis]
MSAIKQQAYIWLGRTFISWMMTQMAVFKLVPKLILLASCSLFIGCGGGGGSNERPENGGSSVNVNGVPSLNSLSAFSTNSPPNLVSCSKAFLNNESCSLSEIKPLGVSTSSVSLSDIESRLVVSHDWMAQSFLEAVGDISSQDLNNLFKSVNAIVISYDIRPSFYHSYTASMYIDPRYLWRNKDEWDSIFKQDDFRSDYGDGLRFDAFRRYVDSNGDYVTWSNTFRTSTYESRSTSQIAPGLLRLLAHELAHANDYLPHDSLSSLGDSGTIREAMNGITPVRQQLESSIPLADDTLRDVADVMFGGANASEFIRSIEPSQAGALFDLDGAEDLYSYYTPQEDVAMLLESLMMLKRYSALSDVAFVSVPDDRDNASCNDYVIGWGQRARLADPNVEQRAAFVAERILGRDVTNDLSTLPADATQLPTNTGWCAAMDSLRSFERVSSYSSQKAMTNIARDIEDDRLVNW